ncbi:MAG: hypothetical protein C0600_11210 [Ignavibacteria bacterium]|nr:MAG: hypothetical protein C0600_11210 [Ignavibacteria bacterium]
MRNTGNDSQAEQIAREIFDRNINNSMKVTGGAFEEVLADIITQLENPPRLEDRYMTAWLMARRIAEAMSEGFAGLPPNGFDFSCWLWESAPLHVVNIPQANTIGTNHGYRYGVIHLRKIAAMIAGMYVQQQPLKAPVVVELIDMSADWVDARNLINYALVDHYSEHFELEYRELLRLIDTPRPWRRMIPIGVAARVLGTQDELSVPAYDLVREACTHVDEQAVYDGLRYVLRVAGMYGDQRALLDFLSSLREAPQAGVRELVCDFIRNPKLRWEKLSSDQVADMLRQWKNDGNGFRKECIDDALERLSLARAS